MPSPGANRTTATLRQQVYAQLRRAIEQGSLRAGTRLPPSREHAASLGVSRNTVLWAVQRLQAEGYVEARVGDGTYVSQAVAATLPAAQGLVAPPRGLSRRGQLIADTAARWRPPLAAAQAFRIGAPEVATFPFALWDRLTRQASTSQRSHRAQYLDPAGDPDLRQAVAQWLWASRGIRCDAAQVVVCSGSQQGIDLIARLLLDVGDEVLVEDPGYPGIRASLLGHGALARPVDMDGDGLRIDTAAAQWPHARMAVVTPTHQFPTGVCMNLVWRQALLQWARTHDAWVVEDDYDGECASPRAGLRGQGRAKALRLNHSLRLHLAPPVRGQRGCANVQPLAHDGRHQRHLRCRRLRAARRWWCPATSPTAAAWPPARPRR